MRIPRQAPLPAALEQWDPGVPDRRIPVGDAAWAWQGAWESGTSRNTTVRASKTAGNEATLRFDGVAVALTGALNAAGGRADVFIDGRKQEPVLDAFTDERTIDNVVWQISGLAPGPHTLRMVASETSRAGSTGREITLTDAVVFRARRN